MISRETAGNVEVLRLQHGKVNVQDTELLQALDAIRRFVEKNL